MKDDKRLLRIALKPRTFFALAAGLFAALALAWMLVGCGGPKKPGDGPENVLLITLDTTRADRLSCYGYGKNRTPAIDALAGRGVLFEHAQSAAPLTLPSHCTIMTGLYPPTHGVRNNGSYVLAPANVTLAEIFRERGLRTAAFVASFTVDSRFGLNQGFDVYDDQLAAPEKIKLYESERPAPEVYASFRAWLEAHADGRFFAWVHFYDPHYPYEPPEPYRSATADAYDGEVACMDHYVGEIAGLLDKLGLADKTLIVLAGDHGEGFGEHKELGHQVFCYEETLHVPLIVVPPGRGFRGVRVKERISLVDVLPTVLDLCGLPPQPQAQGRSLAPAMKGKGVADRALYFESLYSSEVLGCAPLTGLYRKDLKWIDLPRPELYDLAADPDEKDNAVDRRADYARRLIEAEKAMTAALGGTNQGRRQMDLRERERLASLGYISAASSAAPGGDHADPKDRIEAIMQYSTAGDLMRKDRLPEAEHLLELCLRSYPGFAPAHVRLADIAIKQGKPALALERLKRGLEQSPADPGLKLEYARRLFDSGRADDALPLLDMIDLASAQAYATSVHQLRSQILEIRKDFAGAADNYRAALRIEPANRILGRKLLSLYMALDKTPEAFELVQDLVRQTPSDTALVRAAAVLAGQAGRFDQAEDYFRKALAQTSDPAVLFDYAVVLGQKGDYRRALEMMEKFAAQAGPGHEQAEMARKLIQDYKALLK